MPVAIIEEKIHKLPNHYITLVNNYVDELLKKSEKEQNNDEQKKSNAHLQKFTSNLKPDFNSEQAKGKKLPFERFEKYFGMIDNDIDIDKKKTEYFEEKYGHIHRH